MRVVIGLSIVAFAVLGMIVQGDEENEKKISVSDCPPAVQKTLKQEAKNARIVDVDVRKIEGQAIYESEVWFGDREYDLVIREDGLLLSKHFEGQAKEDDDDDGDAEKDDDDGDDDGDAKGDDDDGDDDDGDDDDGDDDDGDDDDDDESEARVRMEDLPRAVRKTLKRESRGGEIDEIAIEKEGGKVVYEAEVEFDKKEYEVEIAANGTLLSKILEDDDDGDDGDDDDDDDDDE